MRIAVIGARRRRQGIGEHLARFVVQAGVDVPALLGTSDETVAEAVATLGASTGHRARGFVDFDAMLAAEPVDGLVIASPHVTHAEYLERALDANLHVLCEKPVVWSGDDPVATAHRISGAYMAAKRHLVVNTQWPFTLPTYKEFFPDVLGSPPTSFWMRMSPSSQGRLVLLDAMPHPLSLIHAAAGDLDATIEDVTFERPTGDHLRVSFDYVTSATRLAATVELRRTPEQPRPAGYGFDGRIAAREVVMDGYQLFFRSDEGRIPLPDPTPMLVRSFVERVASGAAPKVDPAIVPGIPHLAALYAAYEERTPSQDHAS